MNKDYIGRFAPSPTGPLHAGSLLAALASWCDARAAGGQWLLRIEDVDEVRTQAGSVDHIHRTLEAFGLTWDGPVLVQSLRKARYQDALDTLHRQGKIFWCGCSRAELTRHGSTVYPGTCRHRVTPAPDSAVRLRIPSPCPIRFRDRVFGEQAEDVAEAVGDFVIRRRDGFFAYQLAVVVDDADQGVTHVVRGADLLDNTARQIFLQQCLGYPSPDYAHLPLIVNARGEKLSKQTGALAVDPGNPARLLRLLLDILGQALPPEDADRDGILTWAVAHWDIRRVPRRHLLNPDARIPAASRA